MGKTIEEDVYIRDGGVCYYCGQDLRNTFSVFWSFECDHVIPKLQGGQTTLDNLVLSCRSCNNLLRRCDETTRKKRKEWVLKKIEEKRSIYERFLKRLKDERGIEV